MIWVVSHRPRLIGVAFSHVIKMQGHLGVSSATGQSGLGLGGGLGGGGLTVGLNLGGGARPTSLGIGKPTGTGIAQANVGGLGNMGHGINPAGINPAGLAGRGTAGLNIGGTLGRGALGAGTLGAGTLGAGTLGGVGGLGGMGGVGRGMGGALGGIGGGASGLGGLSLAGAQKGTGNQGIFTTGSMNQSSNQQQLINNQLLLSSITMPALFGDERDIIIKKFNQLEAYCGTGKGITCYGGQLVFVEFPPNNPFARFKTICYSRLPTARNEDGLVTLLFNKPHTELLQTQDSLTKKLQDIVGTPSVQVNIDSIKPLPDKMSEVTLYIMEQSSLGSLSVVLANNTYIHLQNQTRKSQLEGIGVVGVYPKTGFSEEEVKLYLATPPAGITAEVWEQCKNENPDPQHYIPVAVVGTEELLKRIKCQDQECKLHDMRLKIMSEDIKELQQAQVTSVARISEYKRKLDDLSHRILKVMVAQEKYRKFGWSVQPVEELLRGKLEAIIRELESPTLLKGRLNEITCQLRIQGHHQSLTSSHGNAGKHLMDPYLTENVKDHLSQQQTALSEMIKIIKTDYADLKIIEEGLKDMSASLVAQ